MPLASMPACRCMARASRSALRADRRRSQPIRCYRARPPTNLRARAFGAATRYTLINDCSDEGTARTQRTLSLRLRPQVQTLLSREGRATGGRRASEGRSRIGRATARSGTVGSGATTKAPDPPALEGEYLTGVHPTNADAPKGRRQLVVRVVQPSNCFAI